MMLLLLLLLHFHTPAGWLVAPLLQSLPRALYSTPSTSSDPQSVVITAGLASSSSSSSTTSSLSLYADLIRGAFSPSPPPPRLSGFPFSLSEQTTNNKTHDDNDYQSHRANCWALLEPEKDTGQQKHPLSAI